MSFNDLNAKCDKEIVKKFLFHRQSDQFNLLFEKLFSRIYKCNKMVLLLSNFMGP